MPFFFKGALDIHLQYIFCHNDKRKRLDSTNLYSNFFTRIRHMERRSHCTEVAKNVFYIHWWHQLKKLTSSLLLESLLFSDCDHWQKWISLFSQSLKHGADRVSQSVSRVKRGNGWYKEKWGGLCSLDFSFLISQLSSILPFLRFIIGRGSRGGTKEETGVDEQKRWRSWFSFGSNSLLWPSSSCSQSISPLK